MLQVEDWVELMPQNIVIEIAGFVYVASSAVVVQFEMWVE